MKLKSLVAGTLVIGMLAVAALAQDAGEKPGKRGHGRRGGPEGGPPMLHGQMMANQQVEQLTKELELTTEQQDKVRKLIDAHHDKMREIMKANMQENGAKLRELRKQIEEAQAAKDAKKADELETQMRKLRGDEKMVPLREKLITDIAGVLTPDQKPKFDKIKGSLFGMRPPIERHPELLMRAIESLNLPKDREQKIRSILDEAKDKMRRPRQRGEDMRAEGEKIAKKMMEQLTPEEQAKVKEWRPAPPDGMGERHHGEGKDGRRQGKPHKGHRHGDGDGDGNATGTAEESK